MKDSDPPTAEEQPNDIAPNFDVMRSIYGVGSASQPEPSSDQNDDAAFATMQSIFGVRTDPTSPSQNR
jgi:hypothetical protein